MKAKLLICAATLLISGPASAWLLTGHYYPDATIEFNLGDICDGARFPVTPGSCAGDAANPNWEVEIVTAMSRWETATSLFNFTTNPADGQAVPGICDPVDPNSIFFDDTMCDAGAFGGTTLAVARTLSFGSGEAVQSDVIFNTAWTWGAYDGARADMSPVQDFRRVAVHELGHVMGLNHPPHTSAIMNASVSDVIAPQPDDVNGLIATYGVLTTLTSPDINGNTVSELVSVRTAADGTISGEVRDADTGTLLRKMTFLTSEFSARDAVVLPDQDGDLNPELAVLAIRKSDERAVVEIRNLAGAQAPRLIWFTAGLVPFRMQFLPDVDLDANDELAVLMTDYFNVMGARHLVEVRNAFGLTAVRQIWFEPFTDAFDLAVIEDADGDGVREFAVLLSQWVDGKGYVEIRNAVLDAPGDPPSRRYVWAGPDMSVVMRIAAVGDADDNGTPDVAIASRRSSNGRPAVEVLNVVDVGGLVGVNRRTIDFVAGYRFEAIAGVGDADGDLVPDVAVMTRRTSDGRFRLEVFNASLARRSIWYSSGFEPVAAVTVAGDIDGNAVPDAAVLLSRRTDGRMLLQQRNISNNAPVTRNRWLSP